jgi:hypothetical protein
MKGMNEVEHKCVDEKCRSRAPDALAPLKAEHKHVGDINYNCQFHQRFACGFKYKILAPKTTKLLFGFEVLALKFCMKIVPVKR